MENKSFQQQIEEYAANNADAGTHFGFKDPKILKGAEIAVRLMMIKIEEMIGSSKEGPHETNWDEGFDFGKRYVRDELKSYTSKEIMESKS